MDKAVRYLDTYWDQIFNYLKDGEYSIQLDHTSKLDANYFLKPTEVSR